MTKIKKFSPMLAIAAEDNAIAFPCLASPKIDGIRALVVDDVVLSRSGKPVPNPSVQELFGHLNGLDGELIVGEPCAPDCFRASQAVMSRYGEPDVTFYAFDDWSSMQAPFSKRHAAVGQRIANLDRVSLLEQTTIYNLQDLDAFEAECLEAGYEGVMIRNPDSPYKFGRSTVREGYLLKVKRFADAEAQIVGMEELQRENGDLGGVMGALHVRDLASGVDFSLGAGFTASERERFWQMGKALFGSLVRYRHFPQGVKDRPRFPVFSGLRNACDM